MLQFRAYKRLAILVPLLLACLCRFGNAEGKEMRVLFIGNSLTYANDLPGIVEALAEASGQPKLQCKSVTFAGFSLEDHWNKGDANREIKKGNWDFVVLQQGPSALPESREHLLHDAKRYAELIRKAGARPAMYMVWPFASRTQDFDRVSESYRLAAKEVDGLVFPVGDAWRAAWQLDPNVALYGPDGFHPTPAASYLAALVIYQKLYGRSPVGLPAKVKLHSGAEISVPAELAKLLQTAAQQANQGPGR